MYTLNLREITLTPAIPEEKQFENQDVLALEDEVVAYIDAAYPGVYSNPLTVARHVRDAIRDEAGTTVDERITAEIEHDKRAVEEGMAKKQAATDELDAFSDARNAEIEAWQKEEVMKVVQEYAAKIQTANAEELPTLEEEREQRLDDINYEAHKRYDAVLAERGEKVKEVWNAE